MDEREKKKEKKLIRCLHCYFIKIIFAFLSRHESLYFAIFKFVTVRSMIKSLHYSYCLSLLSIKQNTKDYELFIRKIIEI